MPNPITRTRRGPEPDEVAQRYTRMHAAANRSGQVLHDDVGPLLSAAGLHLQLLRLDYPRMKHDIDQISAILDQAFERIRTVSQELAPSPVLRGGLKNALEWLAASTAAAHPGMVVKVNYQAAAELPVDAACALYQAAGEAVAAALSATRIAITVRGARLGTRPAGKISIRIVDNGRPRGRAQALHAARRIAEAQGLSITVATKQDTIVLIRYALRSPSSG
jgi:signal transduction histidine kinase